MLMAEWEWYDPVEAKLTEQASVVAGNFYLETAAAKGFSERVKAAIPAGREIVFSFFRRRPDILGYVDRQHSKDLITVEVKEKSLRSRIFIKLKCTRKYSGLAMVF